MKRHKHNMSNRRLISCDMGQLIPIGIQEVLPGESFEMSTALVMRVTPQLKPVMHPVTAHVAHYFYPNRLADRDWETIAL